MLELAVIWSWSCHQQEFVVNQGQTFSMWPISNVMSSTFWGDLLLPLHHIIIIIIHTAQSYLACPFLVQAHTHAHTWAPAYTPTYTTAQYTIYNLTDYEPGAFGGGIEQCKRGQHSGLVLAWFSRHKALTCRTMRYVLYSVLTSVLYSWYSSSPIPDGHSRKVIPPFWRFNVGVSVMNSRRVSWIMLRTLRAAYSLRNGSYRKPALPLLVMLECRRSSRG